jgi:hypothetical protein
MGQKGRPKEQSLQSPGKTASKFSQGILIALVGSSAKADGDDLNFVTLVQESAHLSKGNAAGPLHGKTINTGADGREGNALYAVLFCQDKKVPVAASQLIVLAVISALPNGPYGMNDPSCRKPVAFGDASLARLAATYASAFFQKLWARSAVDGAIYTTTAQERAVCSVDDGVDLERGNICS